LLLYFNIKNLGSKFLIIIILESWKVSGGEYGEDGERGE